MVEAASNDGYLLQYFKAQGIPVLGIEPSANVAEAAEKERGIQTVRDFFGVATAERLCAEGRRADLFVGNNVLAHVPDVLDFLGGVKRLLAPEGAATFEFPHLARLMEWTQFDTIYHEHFSYFSLRTAERAASLAGLQVFDVRELPTHGGSLRLYLRHPSDSPVSPRVEQLGERERELGLHSLEGHMGFEEQVHRVKRSLLKLLIGAKERGLRVAGYGAPAKATTLLNYCGVREALLPFTVDRSPHKQGRFIPGVRIPIRSPDALREAAPDVVLVLPWNLRDEIGAQLADLGARLVVPIPEPELLDGGDIGELFA